MLNMAAVFNLVRAAVVIMAAAGVLIWMYSTWRDLHADD
jgi:hypothetical protein